MSAKIEMKGQKFGRWTVISEAGRNGMGNVIWRCICACGTKRIFSGIKLRHNPPISCGCIPRRSRAADLTGLRFGKWIAIKRAESNERGLAMWHCHCDCGTEEIVNGANLRSGLSKSCGCVKETHSETTAATPTTEYRTWVAMLTRCYNNNTSYYKYYGGRGIAVCDRWRNRYENFLADMGRRPNKGYSLDRINNDGNYEPGNCRWATAKQQASNKRPRRKK